MDTLYRITVIGIAAALSLITATTVSSAMDICPAGVKGAVVFLMDSKDGNKVLSFFCEDVNAKASCKDTVSKTEGISANPQEAVKCESERMMVSKGDKIRIFYPDTVDQTQIVINEADRDTQIATDIGTLIKLVGNFAIKATPEEKYVDYIVMKDRATLSIKIVGPAKDDGKTLAQTSIITGPKEHWYLSADMPITKASQVKYDSTTNSFKEKEAPTIFYIGLNYMLGDVLSDRQSWTNNLIIKGLFKASNSPLDSIGIALAYRQKNVKLLNGISLDIFSPFIGWVWVKQETLSDGAVETSSRYGKPNVVFGISFNLDKALDWVSKDAKKQ